MVSPSTAAAMPSRGTYLVRTRLGVRIWLGVGLGFGLGLGLGLGLGWSWGWTQV